VRKQTARGEQRTVAKMRILLLIY